MELSEYVIGISRTILRFRACMRANNRNEENLVPRINPFQRGRYCRDKK